MFSSSSLKREAFVLKVVQKDGLSHLSGSAWMRFEPEDVQAESITSICVVNQEAKMHCLQQHDNPFNT